MTWSAMAHQGGPTVGGITSSVGNWLPLGHLPSRQHTPFRCQHNEPQLVQVFQDLNTHRRSSLLGSDQQSKDLATRHYWASQGQQSLQGSTRHSPPFDGEHDTQKNDDEHEEASDHTGHLHGVVHLLLWLHSVRILSGGTFEGKEEERCWKGSYTWLDNNYSDNGLHLLSAQYVPGTVIRASHAVSHLIFLRISPLYCWDYYTFFFPFQMRNWGAEKWSEWSKAAQLLGWGILILQWDQVEDFIPHTDLSLGSNLWMYCSIFWFMELSQTLLYSFW